MKKLSLTLLLLLVLTSCGRPSHPIVSPKPEEAEEDQETDQDNDSEAHENSNSEGEAVTAVPSYLSAVYGYEIQFTDDWTLNDEDTEAIRLDLNSDLLENTNVHDAYLMVTAQAAVDLNACLAQDVSDPAPVRRGAFSTDEVEVSNGVTFYTAEGAEGAAGTEYYARYRRTFNNGNCITLEEHLSDSNMGFYEGTSVQDATAEIWERLATVAGSFSFYN